MNKDGEEKANASSAEPVGQLSRPPSVRFQVPIEEAESGIPLIDRPSLSGSLSGGEKEEVAKFRDSAADDFPGLVIKGEGVGRARSDSRNSAPSSKRMKLSMDDIKILVAENKVNRQSKDGNTVLHKAAVEGNVEIATFLLQNDADPNLQNNTGKTALYIASEKGFDELVVLLLEYRADPDIVARARTCFGKAPVHQAAKYGYGSIVRTLLEGGADPNIQQEDGKTALHRAAEWEDRIKKASEGSSRSVEEYSDVEKGKIEAVQALIEHGVDLDIQDNNGDTALHEACRQPTVKRKGLKISVELDSSLTKVASSESGSARAEVVQMLVEFGADVLIENNFGNTAPELELDGSANGPLELMIIRFEAVTNTLNFVKTLEVFSKCFHILESPMFAYNSKRTYLRNHIGSMIEDDNPSVLIAVVCLWIGLKKAAYFRSSEKVELLLESDYWENFLKEILNCEAFDNKVKFNNLFIKGFKEEDDGESATENQFRQVPLLEDGNILQVCLEAELKTIFAKSQVSSAMVGLFFTRLRYGRSSCGGLVKDVVGQKQRGHIENVFNFARYNPAFMFFLEGLCKLATLILTAFVSVKMYGEDGSTTSDPGVGGGGPIHSRYGTQIGLLLMLSTSIVYKLGQMQMSKWRIKKFVLDVWNFLDLTTLGLLLAWGILLGYESAFTAARMVLGLAAIPLAVSLLQYLSIQQDLGELVLIIINMCNDIRIFFLVYMICITGYGIAFLGFYYGFDGYKDIADAYLTLFSASMGNFDYEEFRENSGAVSVYGIAVLTTFLVLTSILLLNLLIARLSSTYNMISERSIEEFSYIKAKNVKKYLRHSEASPLCMLPPPLNAIPTVVWVTGMHGFMMEKFRVSICGAISDLLLEILFFPLSFVYNFFHTLRRFDNKVKESLRSQKVFSVVAYEIGALLLVAVPYNIFVLPVYQFALNVADCVLNPTRVDVPAEKATINYYGLDTFGRDSWGKDSIERFSENWRVSIGRNSMDRSSVTGRDRGASTGSQGERPSEGHRQRATRKKTKAEQFIGYVSGGVYKLASFFFYSRRRIIYDQGRLEEAAAGTEAAAAGNRDVHADDNKMCPLESMNLMVNATRPGYFLKGDIARLLDLLRLDDYNVNVDEAESTKAPASESRGNATDKASAGVDLKENEVTDLQTENAQLEMKLSSLTSEIHEVKSEMASLRSDVSKMLEILGRGK